MERIRYKFALDVTKAEAQRCLTGFSVGETKARQLSISLMNGRNPVHFNGLESVSMFVKRPSDASPSISSCVIDGDTIIYDVLQNDVGEEGITEMTIKVIEMDEELNPSITYAAKFNIHVTDPDCDDSHVPDDPQYSVLEALIIEVEEIKTEMEGYNSDAEAYAIGTRGGVPVEEGDPTYHNNSKYYCENVEIEVEEQVQRAEAWADGTKGGVPVPETDPAYQNNAKYYKGQAATSATNAYTSETHAEGFKNAASGFAVDAYGYKLGAEGFAVGEQGGTPVGDTSPYYHNNAKYYKEQASQSATNAATSESNASGSASATSGSASSASASSLEAEGYAKGTQGGTPVESGSPYYEANAKYYKDQAATSATNAHTSETNASGSASSASGSANTAGQKAEDAEAWSCGKRGGQDVEPSDPAYNNNAKYYADQAHSIVGDKVDSFNNRTGPVTSQKGDYGANKIEIDPTTTSLPNTLDTLQDFLEYAYPPVVSVTLTLNGAKEDSITIYDSGNTQVGSCIFASGQTSGTATIDVPMGGGNYKFISSVSKDTTGSSDFEKTMTLTDNPVQTVDVLPDDDVYFFGNAPYGIGRGSYTWDGTLTLEDVTINTNSISFTQPAINSMPCGTLSTVDVTGKSTLKIQVDVTAVGGNGFRVCVGSTTTLNGSTVQYLPTLTIGNNVISVDITSVTGNNYIAIVQGPSNYAVFDLVGLWLE